MDDERRADNDEKIRPPTVCSLGGFPFRHGLAERDGGRLEESPARLASGRLLSFRETGLYRVPLIPFAAVQACHVYGCPVQLQHFFPRIARLEVQTVDILRDQAVELPSLSNSAIARWPALGRAFFMESYISVAIRQ